MKLSRISVVAFSLALAHVAAAQQPAPANPAQPAQPAPAQPAPAQPAPAQPAPAQPAPAAEPATPPAEAAPSATQGATPEVAAAPAVPAAAATAEKPAEPPPPAKLAVGKEGVFQPGGLLQFWGLDSVTDGDHTDSFRIRRAEIRVKGEIVPKLVAYTVMLDIAKVLEFANRDVDVEGTEPAPTTEGSVTVQQPTSNFYSPFQDFGITFLSDYAEVTAGQFKIPVSLEGSGGSSKILFPERALVSRWFGDKRDIGVKVEKKFDYFYYNLGLYNGGPNTVNGAGVTTAIGSGQNRFPDNDDQKDLALRLEGYPMKGITVAAVGYTGVGERDTSQTKDRVEADLKVEMFNALLMGEFIHGWDGASDTNRAEGQGFYIAGGYTFLDKIQPIVRIGRLDPDIDNENAGSTDEVWHYEGGVNYYLQGQEARLALTFSDFDFDEEKNRYDTILFAQVSF